MELSFDKYKTEEGLVQRHRQMSTAELDLHFYQSCQSLERKTYVYKEESYIQMHYEIANGFTSYHSKHNSQSSINTETGKCTLFYLPVLDGYLYDPVCQNALSFEVVIGESWLKHNLREESKSTYQFLKQMYSKETAVLGNKSHYITPEMQQIIYEINTCPYTGVVKELFIEGKVMLLLGLQLHQVENTTDLPNKLAIEHRDIELLCSLKEILDTNRATKHTIEDLAVEVGMNRTKLQKTFKQCFGMTIHEYVLEGRMNEGYRLLTSFAKGTFTVEEVANLVGYKNYGHFSTMFKKKFGVPPSTFI